MVCPEVGELEPPYQSHLSRCLLAGVKGDRSIASHATGPWSLRAEKLISVNMGSAKTPFGPALGSKDSLEARLERLTGSYQAETRDFSLGSSVKLIKFSSPTRKAGLSGVRAVHWCCGGVQRRVPRRSFVPRGGDWEGGQDTGRRAAVEAAHRALPVPPRFPSEQASLHLVWSCCAARERAGGFRLVLACSLGKRGWLASAEVPKKLLRLRATSPATLRFVQRDLCNLD